MDVLYTLSNFSSKLMCNITKFPFVLFQFLPIYMQHTYILPYSLLYSSNSVAIFYNSNYNYFVNRHFFAYLYNIQKEIFNNMIRLIILVLFLIIYFIISLPFMLMELVIQQFNMNLRNVICLKWVQFGFWMVMKVSGVKTEVEGLENIPEDKAVLFAANHRSYYDIITTYQYTKRPMGYVAKKEMKKIPFLSWIMYFVNCLFLDRENPREGLKTIQKGTENLKNGISMFICPEGTRSRTGEMLPFKEGSLKMAIKAKCPIIPVGIIGSAAIFEDHIPKIKPGKVKIIYGEPIETSQLSRDEIRNLTSYTQEQVTELIES